MMKRPPLLFIRAIIKAKKLFTPIVWLSNVFWRRRWPIILLVAVAEGSFILYFWEAIELFLKPSLDISSSGNTVTNDKKYLYPIIPFLLSAPPAMFIWIWRDQNKRDEIENVRDDISLKDFHQIQQWAVGKGNNETLQIAAIYQLRDFLVGKKGLRFVRPTWELIKSILHNWDEVEFQKSNTIDKSIESHYSKNVDGEDQKVVIPKHIKAIHTLIREESKDLSLKLSDLINFVGIDLKYANLNGAMFKKVNMSGAILERAILSLVDLEEAWLENANLKDANLFGARLSGAHLQCADLSGAQMTGTKLNKSYIINAVLEGTKLPSSTITDTHFSGSNLKYANFDRSNMHKGVFIKCELHHTNFMNAIFENTSFARAKLNHTNFKTAKFKHVIFREAEIGYPKFDEVVVENSTWIDGRKIAKFETKENETYIDFEDGTSEEIGKSIDNYKKKEIIKKHPNLKNHLEDS